MDKEFAEYLDRHEINGERVEFPRGDGWLEGVVIRVSRATLHIEVTDDDGDSRVFVEKVANTRRPK